MVDSLIFMKCFNLHHILFTGLIVFLIGICSCKSDYERKDVDYGLDGKWIASGSSDKTVEIWNLTDK